MILQSLGILLFLSMVTVVSNSQTTQIQNGASVPAHNGPEAEQNLQQVTVTGYIVPRVGDGPQPVVSLDQNFIGQQGDQSVSDVLQRLPNNVGSFTPGVNAGASFSPGASEVNLYGMGVNSTLVLIDGKRQTIFPFPQNGYQSFVDLNSIPLAAVDRIEILKDGASSIYGSDAIAGVVNVILKDDYNGADLNTYYGISQRGDDEVYHVQLTAGISQRLWSDQSKLSLLAAFDFFENSPIDAIDRSYSSNVNHLSRGSTDLTDLRSFSPPNGNFIGLTTGNIYTTHAGTTGSTLGDFDVNNPAFYNTVPGVQLLPRETKYGAYGKLTFQPIQYVQLYDEISYQYNEERSSFTASPVSSTDFITVPTTNPFNLFGEDLDPRLRLLQAGQRKEDAIIENVRNVAGIRLINLPKNWYVDASFVYAESDGHTQQFNYLTKSGLNAALAGTLPGFQGQFFNPFVDQRVAYAPNDAFYRALKIAPSEYARTGLAQYVINAGGELFDLPGGPITAGVGAEYRSNEYIDYKDINLRLNNVLANGGAGNASGKDYDKAVYGEITIPILGNKWSFPGARVLEFVASERYDEYSSFGSAAKPKFSLRYKPFDDLTLRASYSEGFRAPSVTELFGAQLFSFTFVTDPRIPTPPNGNSYEVELASTGNPALKPETAYSYYAGFVWSPGSTDPDHSWWGWANGLTIYGDWTEITKRSVISQEPVQFVINNPQQFPGAVVRDASGNISTVFLPYENLGAIRVDAFDFGGNYSTKEFNWGKINLAVDATYYYHVSQQNLPGGAVYNFTDTYTTPDFKLTASAFYTKKIFGIDTFQTGFTLNFVDSEHDVNDFNTAGQSLRDWIASTQLSQVHTVGSWTTFDFQISYEVGKPDEVTPETPQPGYSKDGKPIVSNKSPVMIGSSAGWRRWFANTKLTFGINNIADTRPPFSDVTAGYDAQVSNPIGRYFYVEVEKKF